LAQGLSAQRTASEYLDQVRGPLTELGLLATDLEDVVIKDRYRSEGLGLEHIYIRQRWRGIEVWNGDIAIHLDAGGNVFRVHSGAWPRLSERIGATEPALSATMAFTRVLSSNLPGTALPAVIGTFDGGKRWLFDGAAFSNEPPSAQLVYVPLADGLRLAWNVTHYTPDGTHWWNVRVDAMTGDELERNDWVSQCELDHEHEVRTCDASAPSAPAAPANAGDLNVYGWPLESPSHGPRSLRNMPWTQGGIASPFGWNDTNGATGPEYTITRGNNVWAKEDIANDNEATIGFAPSGGAGLDFDFPVNLAGAPTTYQSALITNLYYWNNVMHDVWYGYGFTEAAGNFQQNNYGRGGAGDDFVFGDAIDGSGTNNANFATPPDGFRPRMQMFTWTLTTPNRDSDMDNGVIAHEYTHGISNRLVGGPSNTNCLTNVEQMGEGWSDYFALVMTLKAGDTGPMTRGIGTYLLGQAITAAGIRPAPYSTSFATNNYTYASTNNTVLAVPHGMGFVWCTMLWEMTWELIGIHGLDPNIYTGTGGNNIAMRLVLEGMKLTPCNPSFVDARNGILAADQALYGGANQNAIWAAFARRGLGVNASSGTAASRTDQTEAYNTPLTNNVGLASITEPAAGNLFLCTTAPITVKAVVRNFGSLSQTNIPIRYRLNGGAWVDQNLAGPLAAGTSATVTFTTPFTIPTAGAHTLEVATNLAGDLFASDNSATISITAVAATTVNAPFAEGLSAASPTPVGWTLQNPDNSTTWISSIPTMGPGPVCAPSRAWSIDNYNYNSVGQEDRLRTPLVNLAGYNNCRLRFDHAYARYSATLYDAFRVDISPNCGGNWTTLLSLNNLPLATAVDNTAMFNPNICTQWRNNDLDISAYNGQTVLVRFVNINGYGNQLFMDNVSLSGTSSPLPVELLTFRATDLTEGVLLEWSTASESNSDRFDVERSTDLEQWRVIGTRAAMGTSFTTSNYQLLDALPQGGTNYYRLHMVDLDRTSEYSMVLAVDRGLTGQHSFPNPNKGTFTVMRAGAGVLLELLDATGRIVPVDIAEGTNGNTTLRVLDPVPGVYFLRIGNTGNRSVERLVITD